MSTTLPPPTTQMLTKLRDFYNSASFPLFFGSKNIRDQVKWQRSGQFSVLAENQMPPQEPTASETPSQPPPPIEPAVMTLVGSIQPDGFYMKTDGWEGPTAMFPSLASVKLSFCGTAPAGTPFEETFAIVMDNFTYFMEEQAVSGVASQYNPVDTHKKTIKFRHSLFEVCLLCF
jgi:hypothetical protein